MHTVLSERTGFNRAPPTVMHVDLNSCFASVEQQANPLLRGRPVAVAAYTTPGGCILAASREAKRIGIQTGMRVGEGRSLCPSLVVLPPDPDKYRHVNRKLTALLSSYTDAIEVKSIDEMVLDLARSPRLATAMKAEDGRRKTDTSCPPSAVCPLLSEAMLSLGREIKDRIKAEIGEFLTVSIGIAPNRFLAKTASNLHKPDGLDIIDAANIEDVLSGLAVTDLCGIKKGNGRRLARYGITQSIAMYRASIKTLRAAFSSVVGYHWWLRLHGWEADDRRFARKSFGHSYALYEPYSTRDPRLRQVLCQLTEKMGTRLRSHGYEAHGVHVACQFPDWGYWHEGLRSEAPVYASADFFRMACRVLARAPERPVRILAVSAFALAPDLYGQASLFEDENRKASLTRALDDISRRWGGGAVTSGLILGSAKRIVDRIAFGGVKELEDTVFSEEIESEPYDTMA